MAGMDQRAFESIAAAGRSPAPPPRLDAGRRAAPIARTASAGL
jgi:hypothetical protein